jgi:hypothetical protein
MEGQSSQKEKKRSSLKEEVTKKKNNQEEEVTKKKNNQEEEVTNRQYIANVENWLETKG